jgi:hypothetical protein
METVPAQTEILSDSAFSMFRCLICLVHADNVVKDQERLFLRTLLSYLKRNAHVTEAQRAQLHEDLKTPQPIDLLLPGVTGAADRENLVLFAGLLALADGEMHPQEEAVIARIREHCAKSPSLPATQQADGLGGFADEVRRIVRQESYGRALATSGVSARTSPPAVLDAFVQKTATVRDADAYEVMDERPSLSLAMRQSLLKGERVLGKARFHAVYYVHSALVAGLAFWAARPAARHIAGFARDMQVYFSDSGGIFGDFSDRLYWFFASPLWLSLPAPAIQAAAGFYLLWRIAAALTTEIVVTDGRMLIKRGVLFRRLLKTELFNLKDITVNQTPLGSAFNYGPVHVDSTTWSGQPGKIGVTGHSFPDIADPHSFSSLIDRARRMRRSVA